MSRIIDKAVETEISEVFSSVQGEGPYLGVRQIFVRFGRCNMHCSYCDELDKMKEGKFSIYSLERLLLEVDDLEKGSGAHHSISCTGGEPLFYSRFLKNFLSKLKERGLRTYLETNGTLPKELESVIRTCDIIAMDLKPSSSTSDKNFWKEHKDFLKIALQKEVFVKMVITPQTSFEEVKEGITLVQSVNAGLPFIFQPVSEAFGINTIALKKIETEFFPIAQKHLHDVRIIPQMHKIWGVR
ncbi:MAG: 7-carboxy-7-deazaguanine synthase QueE [Candidatus Omnitrophica bacterium]|nr:7-carboxy-7-deazaguanine synthase QueE [Candidatus Omnitrophota bacterium]